jgi:hypothetical protein
MHSRCNIAFDLDGVLVDIVTPIKEKCISILGSEMLDTNSYQIQTNPPTSMTQIWKVFDAVFEDYKKIPILPGIENFIDLLFSMTNDPIRIVTSRPVRVATATHKLIQRFCKVPYVCIITGNSKEKYRYLNNYSFFVEDRRATAIDLAIRGKHIFLIDQIYNRPCYGPRISRIASVEELIPMANHLISPKESDSCNYIPEIFQHNQRIDQRYVRA